AAFCCDAVMICQSVFATQMREQQNVADVGRVGNDHHQTIDANAATTCRWHAVFECADVIGIVIHGLLVAGILGGNLCLEAGSLVFRIVELGETIGNFTTHHEQFKAFCDAGHGV